MPVSNNTSEVSKNVTGTFSLCNAGQFRDIYRDYPWNISWLFSGFVGSRAVFVLLEEKEERKDFTCELSGCSTSFPGTWFCELGDWCFSMRSTYWKSARFLNLFTEQLVIRDCPFEWKKNRMLVSVLRDFSIILWSHYCLLFSKFRSYMIRTWSCMIPTWSCIMFCRFSYMNC